VAVRAGVFLCFIITDADVVSGNPRVTAPIFRLIVFYYISLATPVPPSSLQVTASLVRVFLECLHAGTAVHLMLEL
jgi:hypothetical protein